MANRCFNHLSVMNCTTKESIAIVESIFKIAYEDSTQIEYSNKILKVDFDTAEREDQEWFEQLRLLYPHCLLELIVDLPETDYHKTIIAVNSYMSVKNEGLYYLNEMEV
jgi:hypothetical protein